MLETLGGIFWIFITVNHGTGGKGGGKLTGNIGTRALGGDLKKKGVVG
jgi:hypothetical protein